MQKHSKGFKKRLVLDGDNVASGWNIVETTKFDSEIAYFIQQKQRASCPDSRQSKNASTAEKNHRQTEDHENDKLQIKEDVEHERAKRYHVLHPRSQAITGARGRRDDHKRSCSCRNTIVLDR